MLRWNRLSKRERIVRITVVLILAAGNPLFGVVLGTLTAWEGVFVGVVLAVAGFALCVYVPPRRPSNGGTTKEPAKNRSIRSMPDRRRRIRPPTLGD